MLVLKLYLSVKWVVYRLNSLQLIWLWKLVDCLDIVAFMEWVRKLIVIFVAGVRMHFCSEKGVL